MEENTAVITKLISAKSNIGNKVRNTHLPKNKPLMPLFEVISNSIHAIDEAKKAGILTDIGKIDIDIIRNGLPETLASLSENDSYPIKSFQITDNGIGLNDENFSYYVEADTDHKLQIGGKGVGRFVCLKAFDHLLITSTFKRKKEKFVRKFAFKNTKDGFHDYSEYQTSTQDLIGTTIILNSYQDEYKKNVPKELSEITKEVVTHFQLYFLQKDAPTIIVRNQNNDYRDCLRFFTDNVKGQIQDTTFLIGETSFTLYLTKSASSLGHKLHYCAHNRSVRDESLYTRIVDLGKRPITEDEFSFYYEAFIVSQVLDENVNSERVGFEFPSDDDSKDSSEEISLSEIRKEAVKAVEVLLSDFLQKVREEKLAAYKPIIQDELPQYIYIFNHRKEEIEKLEPNLTRQALDQELYKIETEWKKEVKRESIKILDEAKDIQNLEDYKSRYEKFITEFNEVGKSDLARYVIHRKSVIELLETMIEQITEDKFSDEDLIHSIFFPIRTTSDEVPYDKQNLWLIDERLTYHSFLASDKRFKQIKQLDSTNNDRTDLLIFNDAFAFTEGKNSPYSSFTIIEFKKPQRDGYQDFDPRKNPVDQVEKYIKEILSGKAENRVGRKIVVDKNMPFYVYIICDITSSLEEILHAREFDKTPDGQGYFRMYTKYYNAYVEVLPFEKVLLDAKKRNRILFEKLGIDN